MLKIKIMLLFIIVCLIVFITYNFAYNKETNIISINSLYKTDNYNIYLSKLFTNSKINYSLNVDFSNEDLEIENLLNNIRNNENSIQTYLHNADAIILSIGNIDYKNESLNTIISELETLFKNIRLINTKQVFYISPSIIKNTTEIKSICHKYNIIYLNGSSFRNKNNLLAQIIFHKIDSLYNK